MKRLLSVLLIIVIAAAFVSCNSDKNPTSPSKEELGSDETPQQVPEAIATALIEQGGEGINTEYAYSSSREGDVVWKVDTSKSSPVKIPGIGGHAGELKFLDITVVFKKPYFLTAQGYAGYYIGLPMEYEIRVKNNGNRTFKHLDFAVVHEYYESGTCDRWWYPYPQEVTFSKGEPMPGDSMIWWRDAEIGAGEELVLNGTYTAPIETCAGLDQIHLAIQHTNNGALHAATMYYNPEAAVYCPPPPAK